jgi:hypothetical protein
VLKYTAKEDENSKKALLKMMIGFLNMTKNKKYAALFHFLAFIKR